jgi:hypothetical protein
MRPKKLLPYNILEQLVNALELGVPLSAAMRQQSIKMSQPAVAKLVKQFRESFGSEDHHIAMYDSLFPSWNKTSYAYGAVIEQPEGWYYEGYFPYGEWVQR